MVTGESNCVIPDCTASDRRCDTQVFVTWKGTDLSGAMLLSDEKRISGFTSFDVSSYYTSATELASTTYYFNV